MAVQKLRKHPIGFGTGSASRTKALDERIAEYSHRLLKGSDYHGFAAIEWKWDPRDGTPKLIEVNPRPVGYHRLFDHAGINYVGIILEDAVSGSSREGDFDYRSKIHWVDPFADLYEFKRRRNSPGFSYLEFFRPYYSKPVYGLSPLTDPGPWIARVWTRIRGKTL